MEFLLWLQGLRNPALDALMLEGTYLGDQIAVIAVICTVLWCVDREAGVKLAFVFFLGGMASQLLKLIFVIERPWVLDARILPLDAALHGATGWSFPSGHTAAAVALYGGVFMMVRRWWARGLCIAAAALVALSRLYAGVHSPADVLASIVTGVALVYLSWKVLGMARNKPQVNRWVLLFSLCLAVAMVAAVAVRHWMGYDPAMLEDAVAAAGAALGFLAGWWLLRKRQLETRAPIPWQAAKAALGLAICVGIKALEGGGFIGILLNYALVAIWAVALYPMLFTRLIDQLARGERA